MRRLLISGLLMLALTVQAMVPDMKFRRLDTRDGLSNTQVNCIYRDSRGMVWIGTLFGLNRYDGYRVRVYYSLQRDTTTMPYNLVDDIQEAADGRLWLRQGTEYAVFDPLTEQCDRHPKRWLQKMGITDDVERVYIDRHKNFWVKTYNSGLWHLDVKTGKVRQFAFGNGQQQIRSDFGVSDFEEYGRSLLMVSNNGDLVCLNTSDVRISWKSDRLRRISTQRNAGFTLCIDNSQNIWVMVGGNVYCYVRKAGRWVNSIAAALQQCGIGGFPPTTKVWDVTLDRQGRLWFSTDHQGLIVADLRTGEMRQFLNVRNDETTISDNTLRRIYRDSQDRMWIATYMNGVNYFADNLFNFRHIGQYNVNTVCVDSQGNYWAGTNDNGIVRYNPTTGEQTVYGMQATGLGSDVIVSSMVARDGTLWFGSYDGGLAIWQNGHFKAYKAGGPDGLTHNSVWTICEDSKGNVWIGTLGGGMQKIDRTTGKFTTLTIDNSELPSNHISSISETADGRMLVAHTEFYSLVDTATLKVENCRIDEQQADNPVTKTSTLVIEDSRRLIWQGAASGATVIDKVNNRYYLLDMKSGLVGSTVNSIVEDAKHTMWVVTEQGISNVVPQQQTGGQWKFIVINYTNRDGLQGGPFNQRSAAVAPNGMLLVGGHEGIDVVNTNTMATTRRTAERPVFSGVKVMDRNVERVGERLHLKSSEKQFTIQMASDNGEVHNRARFAYRLDGINSQWQFTEEAQPDISFMGLPSGTYTLLVRLMNGDGTMGDDELQLPIVIDAPWYRSWWMVLIYCIAAIVAARWFYMRYQQQLHLHRLKLEQESNYKLNESKKQFYESVNDELRQPFLNVFESLYGLMQRENDELRYEEEQKVFGHVESLLEQVNQLSASGQSQEKLKPQIREMEITSLDEKLVADATRYVEDNLANTDISVETMAQQLGMSRVHLYKRLTAVTDLTPSEFIRQIRLRHGEQLLKRSQLTVAEVAYKVGFNNPRYFSRYFKEMYGVMPSEYKNKTINT